MRGEAKLGFVPRFYQTNPFLDAFPGGTGDVHVYGHGRRDVPLAVAGGLETLKLVQGLVEAPPYRLFVAGELGEGVGLVCVPYEGSTERGGLGDFVLGLHFLGLGEGLLLGPFA